MVCNALAGGMAMKWNDRIGRRLKLHDLHVLMAVTEMGSMGKAAERLAVSQPSVSKAISDMEHTIGVRLLDRTSKGVEATAYGRALLRRGLAAFEELREGIKEIEALADPTAGEVRVGCPDVFTGGLMSAVIDHFSRQYPRVIVHVIAVNNVTQEFRQLRDRAVDFLLAGFPISYADDDLDVEILYEHRPSVVAGRNSRWARRRKIELAELAEEPWLLPREGIFVSLLTEAFRAQGLVIPRFGVRSYSVHQRMMLLATDRFISAEVGSVLRFHTDRFAIKVLPVNLAIRPWPVGIVTLKNRTVSPVVQNFLNSVRKVGKSIEKST
jgi:DNA-binding transcriptional LysR family regulator